MGATTIRHIWAFPLAVALVACLAAGCADDATDGKLASFAEAKSLAASQGKPILIDFFADW
jgi:hypothetical protein